MHRILCLIPLLAAPAAAQEPSPARGVNFYSLEKEVALGSELAAEFRRNTAPLDSPAALAYVSELGGRLASQAGGPAFHYQFALTSDDSFTHEPAAFPGGFVFVPAGLILAAKDADEFAGMLAHAIAHVAARHGTREATRGELVSLSTIPIVYMGGWTGFAIRQGAEIAIPLGMLAFRRTLELQADGMAARAMSAAEYDPAALARYLEREQSEGDVHPRAFAALPPVSQRIARIQSAIDNLPAQVYPAHAGFEAVQEEVRRLTPVKAPPTLKR